MQYVHGLDRHVEPVAGLGGRGPGKEFGDVRPAGPRHVGRPGHQVVGFRCGGVVPHESQGVAQPLAQGHRVRRIPVHGFPRRVRLPRLRVRGLRLRLELEAYDVGYEQRGHAVRVRGVIGFAQEEFQQRQGEVGPVLVAPLVLVEHAVEERPKVGPAVRGVPATDLGEPEQECLRQEVLPGPSYLSCDGTSQVHPVQVAVAFAGVPDGRPAVRPRGFRIHRHSPPGPGGPHAVRVRQVIPVGMIGAPPVMSRTFVS